MYHDLAHLSIMPPGMYVFQLDDSAFPVLLLSVPKLARHPVRIWPSRATAREVLALLQLFELLAVVHALVRGCELVGISLGVVGQRDVPCQWGDGELCASWGGVWLVDVW
jgi:hypothetical protein